MNLHDLKKAGMIGALVLTVFASKAMCLSLDEQTEVYASYALEAKGDFAGAIQKMVKVQSANADQYFPNYRLGYLMSMSKKYSNAVNHYEKAAKINSSSVEPWLAISLMSLYSGDEDRVMSASKEVLSRDPKNYFGLARLAGVQIRKKDYSGALETASNGLKGYPSDALFLEQKGFALKSLGKTDEAKAVAKDLILLSPSNVFAKSILH
jgi:tetratricopeptide (TPR) repeat protein